jgi:hypothetical protein
MYWILPEGTPDPFLGFGLLPPSAVKRATFNEFKEVLAANGVIVKQFADDPNDPHQ